MNPYQLVKGIFQKRTTPTDLDLYAADDGLFGTLGRTAVPIPVTKDFIPVDSNGNVINWQNLEDSAPIWLGLDNVNMQQWAYNLCTPLAAVIDKLAEADTNGILEMTNKDGSIVTSFKSNGASKRVMELLNNPNPNQTFQEFNSQQIVLCKIFGYTPVFAVGPKGMDKSYTEKLWNLSPYFCRPVINNDFSYFGTGKRANMISHWEITMFGITYKIAAEDILLVKDGFTDNINNHGLPISKIAGLDYFVSNIMAAMEADNVLLKKKGPLGVFSHDPKPDLAGWVPLDNDDKKELQDDLRQYGLSHGKKQHVISKTPIKWNPMSFNVRDLMTKETVRQAIDTMCDRYGFPAELMSGKNATYENRSSAEKFLYQNNIIPFSLRRMARYNKFFGVEGLRLHYAHLPVLQEDIMKAGQGALAASQGLEIDWKNGIISYNEYRHAKGYDEIAGKDDYFYQDWLKDNPDMNPNKPKEVKPDKDAKPAEVKRVAA